MVKGTEALLSTPVHLWTGFLGFRVLNVCVPGLHSSHQLEHLFLKPEPRAECGLPLAMETLFSLCLQLGLLPIP